MTLVVDGVCADQSLNLRAAAGEWVVVKHWDPGAAVAEIAGLVPSHLSVSLDAQNLTVMSPVQRHAAQLCAASCRLDQLPALRVADVVGLGLRAPQPALWHTLLGGAGTRRRRADDEAQVRALAGRIGLAAWVDRTAAILPLKIEALTDIARAMAGVPKALVWRRPEWLDPVSLREITEAVSAEQHLARFAVVEFVQARAANLPQQ